MQHLYPTRQYKMHTEYDIFVLQMQGLAWQGKAKWREKNPKYTINCVQPDALGHKKLQWVVANFVYEILALLVSPY